MTTRWQYTRLRLLSRRMVRLENLARRAELQDHPSRAERFWWEREQVQWHRSLLLRDLWAQDHVAPDDHAA
jgi:hypothetical protein